MNHGLFGVGGFIVAAAIVTATPQDRPVPSWSPTIETVTSPTGPNSAQPQLSASSRGPILSWVERDGQRAMLRFAERTATGWSAPRTVASGNDRFVNWADVPSVVRLASGTLVGQWLQKSGTGTAGLRVVNTAAARPSVGVVPAAYSRGSNSCGIFGTDARNSPGPSARPL